MKTFALAASLVLYLSCAEPGRAASVAESPPREADEPAAAFDASHARWSRLLERFVDGDRVDYAGLREERAQLQVYLDELAAVSPDQLAAWTRGERFAFWINVYNAFCVQLVVDHYPLESIRDIGGKLLGRVWDEEFIPLRAHHPGGADDLLSLNDVEHEILRERFPDARLHAAINCASVSCPPLRAEAFTAQALERQLDEQMRGFLDDPLRNRLDRSAGKVAVSAIFDWFSEDFERDAGSVRGYLARFVEEGEWILEAELEHLDYDWSLNDVERDVRRPDRGGG